MTFNLNSLSLGWNGLSCLAVSRFHPLLLSSLLSAYTPSLKYKNPMFLFQSSWLNKCSYTHKYLRICRVLPTKATAWLLPFPTPTLFALPICQDAFHFRGLSCIFQLKQVALLHTRSSAEGSHCLQHQSGDRIFPTFKMGHPTLRLVSELQSQLSIFGGVG